MRLLVFIFFIWRIGLFIIAWMGEKLLPFTPRFPYSEIYLTTSGLPAWFWSFANFDGVHYLGIAQKGYWAQYTQVFFPLYPLLLRLISVFFPFLNPVLAGILLSNFFFFLTLLLFYNLIKIDHDKETSRWSTFFLLAFPTSFFFGGLYTEGLFFFLLICSFYFSRNKRWWLAAVFGGLASAAKLIGIFLLPALLWEWWESKNKEHITINKNSKTPLTSYFSLLTSPVVYLVPIGLISYMIYLQLAFGDALYFWHVQPVFGAQRSGGSIIFLPQVLYRYMRILTTNSVISESFWIPLLELTATLLAIGTLVKAHFLKVRMSYLIFCWLAILVPTLTGTLSSMPRYVLVAFPMYIVLAQMRSSILKTYIIPLFLILLGILTVLFTRGHWVA